MPLGLSSILNPVPCHLSVFAALFGTQIYQSFFMTRICYRALPMTEFVTLQSRVFPVYFTLQTLGALLTIITYPHHPGRLVKSKRDAIFLGTLVTMSLLNSFIYGPRTRQAMFDRAQQEAVEGRAYNAAGDRSDEMQAICRCFSKNHAMSIHLNFIAIVASVLYMFSLGARVKIQDN